MDYLITEKYISILEWLDKNSEVLDPGYHELFELLNNDVIRWFSRVIQRPQI